MAPVVCNVYDLSPQNAWAYWCGIGIYHAGVEVYGTEYAFGGHEYDCSGVFATNPRDAPGNVIFRESHYVGETDLSQAEVQQLVARLGQEFKGNKYHLLQKNCNHFATDLCLQLVGKPAPAWVNRLAGIAVMLHCLLPESLVPALQTPSMDHEASSSSTLLGSFVEHCSDSGFCRPFVLRRLYALLLSGGQWKMTFWLPKLGRIVANM
eukprot:gene27130-2359_t